MSDSRLQRLLASKMQQWKADRNYPRFTTTSKVRNRHPCDFNRLMELTDDAHFMVPRQESMDKVAHLAQGLRTKQAAVAPSSAAEGGQG